jgi:hypothetical protein
MSKAKTIAITTSMSIAISKPITITNYKKIITLLLVFPLWRQCIIFLSGFSI